MPDDTKNRGGQDRRRINVNQDYELRDWANKFGVSKEELKAAVEAVSNQADKVEVRLKGGRMSTDAGDRQLAVRIAQFFKVAPATRESILQRQLAKDQVHAQEQGRAR